MTTLPKDFKEFIELLSINNVRYIIDLENLIKASNRTRDRADAEELT